MSDGLTQLFTLIQTKNYIAIAVLVIGYSVRLTAPDSKFPINISPRWKPVVVLGLGQLYAMGVAIQSGMNWKPAVFHGLMTALITMGLFDVVMKAVWNGNEPAWLKKIAGVVDDPETLKVIEDSGVITKIEDELADKPAVASNINIGSHQVALVVEKPTLVEKPIEDEQTPKVS